MMNSSNELCHRTMAETPSACNKFIFRESCPTLQQIASQKIALTILKNLISSHLNQVKNKKYSITSVEVLLIKKYHEIWHKMIESLKTPTLIEQVLKSIMQSVYQKTKSWITFFQYHMFPDNLAEHRIKHFDADCFVWLSNGEIDYANTALKMLSISELTLVQRFVILCEYCVKEEIEKISWRSLPEAFMVKLEFNQNSLIYYWISYLKNELHMIPLNNYTSVDVRMAVICKRNSWTAFGYFWNRLKDNDQITVAAIWFTHSDVGINHERILSKMSWQQQRRLLLTIPEKILINFWVTHRYEFIMWTWNASKDLMSPKKFGKFVSSVLYYSAKCENVMRYFLEIWNSASDQQRNYILETQEDVIWRGFLSSELTCSAAFEFLYVVLSLKDEEFRRGFLLQSALKTHGQINDPKFMNEIVKLCLPNPVDQLEYKTLIMESFAMQSEAETSFRNAKFEDFILKLKYYSTNAKILQEFLTRAFELKYNNKIQYLMKVEKWNKFSQFMDEILSEDATSALKLKKQFIMSCAQVYNIHWKEYQDETIKILEMVLTNNNELQVVKKHLLDSFQRSVNKVHHFNTGTKSYIKNFTRLLSWCFNGDERAVDGFLLNIRKFEKV